MEALTTATVKPGLKVVTRLTGDSWEATRGWLIHEKHENVRETGITGVILDYVPGHGGDVWYVRHGDSEVVGAYNTNELLIA